MIRSFILFVSLVLAAAAAGCAGSEPARQDPYALSERALHEHLDQLTAPAEDSAQAVRRGLYAARRMGSAGLMPVFASSFLMKAGSPTLRSEADPARAHVLGYVPGRHPSHADTLVLVAADLDRPAAAAVLETARRLALEALDAQVPERTVLFALWAPPFTGAQGLADYLARPTWGLERVARVVLVTADSAEAGRSEALLDAHGIAAEVIAVPPMGEIGAPASREVRRAGTRALAELLYVRTRQLGLAASAVPHVALQAPSR